MSVKRNSPLLEASESLNTYRESFQQKQQRKLEESAKRRKEIEDKIYFGTKERKANARKSYVERCNNIKNELLASALRGIYIGALQENTALTDSGLLLAHNLVDNFIKESGGANVILSKISGKTYSLDFIKSVVEGTYESILEESEESEDSEEEKDTENKDTDTEEEDTVTVNEEIPEEKKSEMYDDLNNDDDISNAVNIIANRIADAEKEFIEKNNEDKKTLEDIASKFSERIKKVEEDESLDDGEKEELQEESSRLVHKALNNRRENRTRNIFEQIVINFTESVLKDDILKEEYAEDGKLNMPLIVESAKCIYGFLETVNTLQIHRITPKYISEALSTI